jgi:hypothetical protein
MCIDTRIHTYIHTCILLSFPVGRTLKAREDSSMSQTPSTSKTKKKSKKSKKKKANSHSASTQEDSDGQAAVKTGSADEVDALKEAEDLLRLAVRTNQGNSEAWYNLGTVLKMKGNKAEAQHAYARCLFVHVCTRTCTHAYSAMSVCDTHTHTHTHIHTHKTCTRKRKYMHIHIFRAITLRDASLPGSEGASRSDITTAKYSALLNRLRSAGNQNCESRCVVHHVNILRKPQECSPRECFLCTW